MSALANIQTVAIVDDYLLQAETIAEIVRDAGYTPAIIDGSFGDEIDVLVDKIVSIADAAVFDHRLTPGGFATFPGAAAAARLIERKKPAVLVTQFGQDRDVSIRRWRPWIPVVLAREDVAQQPDSIADAIEASYEELTLGRQAGRRTQRCLVRIENNGEEGEPVLDVFISGWHPERSIRIPCASLPIELVQFALPGMYLTADVNTEADDEQDLFFENFAIAPDPAEIG